MPDINTTLAAIKKLSGQHIDESETELLTHFSADSLAEISSGDVHSFCTERKWTPKIKDLYWKWLFNWYQTPEGEQQLQTVIKYLVCDDHDTLVHAANEWKESGFSSDKLKAVQEIAAKLEKNELGIYPDNLIQLGKDILEARPPKMEVV